MYNNCLCGFETLIWCFPMVYQLVPCNRRLLSLFHRLAAYYEARKAGKKAVFSKSEPDNLFINGKLVVWDMIKRLVITNLMILWVYIRVTKSVSLGITKVSPPEWRFTRVGWGFVKFCNDVKSNTYLGLRGGRSGFQLISALVILDWF